MREEQAESAAPITSTLLDECRRSAERLNALQAPSQLDSLAMSSPKLTNRESEMNSARHLNYVVSDGAKAVPSPKFNQPFALSESLCEPVEEEPDAATAWEYLTVSLTRVPTYGFGIAVSGGRDNPHFKSGDPSIVISDVLRAGPAWTQLQVNDRIVSANSISLENVEYNSAVQIIKENEQLNMVVKRRVPVPFAEFEQRTLKFTLSKSKRKDDFGIVLGCKFFVKDLTNPRLAEKDPGLKGGDTVLQINGQACDNMTLAEATKLLERSRERLSLVVQRDVPRGSCRWTSQTTLYERLGSVVDTPKESPRASPRVAERPASQPSPPALNNGAYQPQRNADGLRGRSGSDYGTAAVHRHSVGARPPSRSRPASQNALDDYGPPHQPPPPPPQSLSPTRFIDEDGATGDGRPASAVDVRTVAFNKDGGSVGIRVVGGNETGIFVSAVQLGSMAANMGVRAGDKILRVNQKDMAGVTREEAVSYLLGLQERVSLLLEHSKDEYERVRSQNIGDNFYIRTHFDYENPTQGEATFRKGDIFQVIDTLYGGSVGAWQAVRVSSPTSPAERPDARLVIPNLARAEKLASLDSGRVGRAEEPKSGTLWRRKMRLGSERRAKSLTKGHWDEVVFAQGAVDFPAYERVKLKHPAFVRPVVVFGPLADVARDMLLLDFPLRFASAQQLAQAAGDAATDKASGSGFVRLSAIRQVMNANKHCLLDVTPSSVEKLQLAQFCPIVVFVGVESRSRLRELRSRRPPPRAQQAPLSTRKLMDQAARIQKHYPHLFSATLDATKEDHWFDALRDLVAHLQERRVWMSERRAPTIVDDDFLFPMADSRYANCRADSDADSLKGDYSELGGALVGSPADPLADVSDRLLGGRASAFESVQARADRRAAPTYARYNGHFQRYFRDSPAERPAAPHLPPPAGKLDSIEHDVYANHEALSAHFASLQRQPRQRDRPPPPPRHALARPPAVPVAFGPAAPRVAAVSTLPLRRPPADNVFDSPLSDSPSEYTPSTSRSLAGRQFSEPGCYDVKQILADNSEDADGDVWPRRSAVPMSPAAFYQRQTSQPPPVAPNAPGFHEQIARYRPSATAAPGLQSSAYASPSALCYPTPPMVSPSHAHFGLPHEFFGASQSPYQLSQMSEGLSPAPNGRPLSPRKSPVPPPAPSAQRSRRHTPPLPPLASLSKPPANVNGDTAADDQPCDTSLHDVDQMCSRLTPEIKSPQKPPVPQKPPSLLSEERASETTDAVSAGDNSGSEERAVMSHVSGVFGAAGGVLSSDETGVSVHIPPGALPDGAQQEIYFKVCRDDGTVAPLDEASGETLLSPLVMCGPQGLRFATPVELRLPHSASNVGQSDQWSFALKAASGSDAEWKQVSMASDESEDKPKQGTFEKDYVAIQIDAF